MRADLGCGADVRFGLLHPVLTVVFTIPADVIEFDDTVTKLGVSDLQNAVVVLVTRLALLEAENAALKATVSALQFDQAANSGNQTIL